MQAAVDLAQLVTVIGDAIIVAEVGGAITLWNPAAVRMFGFTEQEALGQPLDMIIPERLRQRHWEGFHQTMLTGETKYGTDLLRVPAVDKSGRSMSVAFTVALLFSAAGKPAAIAAVIRDETRRFNEERSLRKRLAELDAALAAGKVSS